MMDEALFFAFFLLPVALLVVGGAVGRVQERRHLRSLHRREPRYRHMVVTDLGSVPPSIQATGAFLVVGDVVIGSDRGKQFVGGLRTLLGGRVRSFEMVMARARSEAYFRMMEEARSQGAGAVVNVRLETSEVGGSSAEVLCYGTALVAAGQDS